MAAKRTTPRSQELAQRVLSDMGTRMEQEYREGRKQASENLWNAFVAILRVQQPSHETTLYVLEMLKIQVLQQRFLAEFSPGAPVSIDPIPEQTEETHGQNGNKQDSAAILSAM